MFSFSRIKSRNEIKMEHIIETTQSINQRNRPSVDERLQAYDFSQLLPKEMTNIEQHQVYDVDLNIVLI